MTPDAMEKEVAFFTMNEVNKTLYIPLYGKALVSRKGIILKDSKAEQIWKEEGFMLKGKSKSKWLTYNMAMRAKIFDVWTGKMLRKHPDALVLHIGCGLDSRCLRIPEKYRLWIDGDFPEVLSVRKKYFSETENYHMLPFDASKPEMVKTLPESETVIVILEGISMYLKKEELNSFFKALTGKYKKVRVLMDTYTVFGAKASKYKNPINDVGVTTVYGMDDVSEVVKGTRLKQKAEHSMTLEKYVRQLKASEQWFFRWIFNGKLYRQIYRLYELEERGSFYGS